MRITLERSDILMDKIQYRGYLIDQHIMRKVQQKVNAIQNVRRRL